MRNFDGAAQPRLTSGGAADATGSNSTGQAQPRLTSGGAAASSGANSRASRFEPHIRRRSRIEWCKFSGKPVEPQIRRRSRIDWCKFSGKPVQPFNL